MGDAAWDEGAAFEELLGSHCGLGGSQNRPFLKFPAKFDSAGETKDHVGTPAIYNLPSRWLSEQQPTQEGVDTTSS